MSTYFYLVTQWGGSQDNPNFQQLATWLAGSYISSTVNEQIAQDSLHILLATDARDEKTFQIYTIVINSTETEYPCFTKKYNFRKDEN